MSRGAPLVLVLLALFGSRGLAQELPPPKADVAAATEEIEKGMELFNQEKVTEALERFTRARELDPYESKAPYMIAKCEFHLAKQTKDPQGFERARRNLLIAESLDPMWGKIYFLWGLIGAETKRFRDAVVGFQESINHGERIPESRVNLAQSLFFFGAQQAEQDVNATEVIRTLQDAVDMLEVIKDDLEFNTEIRETCRKLWIQALTYLAAMRQRSNDLPEAEAILVRLSKLEPANYLHSYNLGLIYGSSKRNKEALENYQRAMDLNPDETWDEPLKYMGYIHSQDGNNETAEKLLLRYAERHPDLWDTHFYLGDHYFRVGRLEEAVTAFSRCVELDPALFTPMYKLAQALRRLKRPREADKWLGVYRVLEAK